MSFHSCCTHLMHEVEHCDKMPKIHTLSIWELQKYHYPRAVILNRQAKAQYNYTGPSSYIKKEFTRPGSI
jgi:hypothetical protein